jgi:predicted membrane-bound mannosyltransferase
MPNRLSLEHALFILIVLLALFLRLLNLGAAPLAEGEATLALKAFDLAQGERAPLDPQPGYVALTGATFALFGGSEFTARWWPALTGGLLALVPFFFRRALGREAARPMGR